MVLMYARFSRGDGVLIVIERACPDSTSWIAVSSDPVTSGERRSAIAAGRSAPKASSPKLVRKTAIGVVRLVSMVSGRWDGVGVACFSRFAQMGLFWGPCEMDARRIPDDPAD